MSSSIDDSSLSHKLPKYSSTLLTAANILKTTMVGRNQKQCVHFKRGTCRYGAKCKFSHAPGDSVPKGKKLSGNVATARTPSETDFKRWTKSLGSNGLFPPLMSKIGDFFQEARRLAAVGPGLTQDVVSKLASEGGLHCIKEAIEQESGPRQRCHFDKVLMPLFTLITRKDILDSLVLEREVARLYNFLYGVGGQRASRLLRFFCEVLGGMERDTDSFVNSLEVVTLVFCKVLDFNSGASLQPSLQQSATQLHSVFLDASATLNSNLLVDAQQDLSHVLRRLELGLTLPEKPKSETSTRDKKITKFSARRDPPGGRHDNDSEDICQIRILPSLQEILSPRAEYVPYDDPTTWHVQGIDGLLDRNFRLLREESIGQLRDAVHFELARLSSNDLKSRRSNGVSTYVYRHAKIQKLFLSQPNGFHFHVRIRQPKFADGMTARERNDWWTRSRRLQPDSLVCLTDLNNLVIFCMVVRANGNRGPHDKGKKNKESNDTDQILWKDSKFPIITLRMVEENKHSLQEIFRQQVKNSEPKDLVIIEFRGILLSAFEPTLKSLQQIKKSGDLPFADILAPSESEGLVEVEAPQYSLRPGFSFSLKSILAEGDMRLTPGQEFDVDELAQRSTLDRAQANSLVHVLTQKFSLIQGPPGTGKSYTGVSILKVLLDNRKQLGSKNDIGPVICVCYTNHALDQLLEDVLDAGITSQVIRLGSQSKSERLENHNIRVARGKIDRTKTERSQMWDNCRSLEELEQTFSKNYTILPNSTSPGNIARHLRRELPDLYRSLGLGIDEGFEKQGSKSPGRMVEAWLRGKASPLARKDCASETTDLYALPIEQRRTRFRDWVTTVTDRHVDSLSQTVEEFWALEKQRRKVLDEQDVRALRQAHIIGCTTSGFARNIETLRRVNSQIILCEEAGEVLEPHLLAAFLPSLQQAILIGDHQQLRPQVQNFELSRENLHSGKRYCLDVSLFERLVQPLRARAIQLPYSSLEVQRRMHPSFSSLIRQASYPRLQDHPTVSAHPAVAGMKKRLYWIDHRENEDNETDDTLLSSHRNEYEIEMTAALVTHLIQQGSYKGGEIAVLTPYLGQLQGLRERLQASFTITVDDRDQTELEAAGLIEERRAGPKLSKTTLLQNLRVATIDNFQGEEADVVVISLVRSNPQRSCGFLKTSNRINVLLSRARHGMYIVGDSETALHVPMWADVIRILKEGDNFGPELELQCPRHPEKCLSVSKGDDFAVVAPEGGCSERCIQRLPCGHACTRRCHSEILHSAVHCLEPCQKAFQGCDHSCPNVCGDPCPIRCPIKVVDPQRKLDCGHVMSTLPCWQAQNLQLVRCSIRVQRRIPACGHDVEVLCCDDITSEKFRCPATCKSNLPCGHACLKRCSDCHSKDENGNHTFDHGRCKRECGRAYKTCAHVCKQACHGAEPCLDCPQPCDVSCNHSRCPEVCSAPCTPCAEERCMSACPHSSCSLPCAAPCNHVPCSKRCEKNLSCGHTCPSVCGEICPNARYCQSCGNDDINGRMVDLLEGKTYSEIDLATNPCIFPRCGHFYTMESMDGNMSMTAHYENIVQEDLEVPVSIKATSKPFSASDVPKCADCRGSLRDIARYGRLVRRAILDESMKKLIIWMNKEYQALDKELQQQLGLARSFPDKRHPMGPNGGKAITLHGTVDKQAGTIGQFLATYDSGFWASLRSFRAKILLYREKAKVSEQPFARVRAAVAATHRRTGKPMSFDFDESVLQTKGFMLALSILLQLDLALLTAALSVQQSAGGTKAMSIDFVPWKKLASELLQIAISSVRVAYQVEAYTFLARIIAIQKSREGDVVEMRRLADEGNKNLDQARALCKTNPDQTRGQSEEINKVAQMLRESTFYTPVTNDERRAILAGMATELRGTGHWYYCQHGHPFTIGECGMPMERATCPECGTAVGGQNHSAVDGIRHADDLEGQLRTLSV